MKRKNVFFKSHPPGVDGNPFDIFLKGLQKIQFFPNILFFISITAASFLINNSTTIKAFCLLAFSLLDWLLIWLLQKLRFSFGPPKPAVMLLFILRSLFSIFPTPVFIPFQFVGSLMLIYGFWIEPHQIHTSHQDKEVFKDVKNEVLRILHVSDLHIEFESRREKILLKRIKDLKPDLILITGDILNLSFLYNKQSVTDAITIMNQLSAPLGVYFVSGSPAVDRPDVLSEIIPRTPNIIWLQDRIQQIYFHDVCINLIGIICSHNPEEDHKKLRHLLLDIKDCINILLYHSPDIAPLAAKEGIKIQFSGHTHGGQVRMPLWGAIVTGSLLGKKYESGRYEIGEMTLYVSRGLGMEGLGAPRVRFNCPPEITLWELF